MRLQQTWKAYMPFLLLLWPIQPVHAQQQSHQSAQAVLDLDQIIAEVIANNPELTASRLDARAASTVPAQVSALPDPAVMFSVLPFPIYTARGSQRSQFRVEQMFPFPGKIGLQKRMAELGETVAHNASMVLASDLILDTKQAYFDLTRVSEQRRILLEFQDRLDDFEQIAAAKYEVGSGTQQAVLKAQLERSRLSDRLLELQRVRRSAEERLSTLMHRPVGDSISLIVDPSRSRLPDVPVESFVSVALGGRPEINSLDISAERARLSQDLAKKQSYPDFGVNLTYFDLAESSMPSSADGKDALAIGVSVKLPLQKGPRHARIEEAQITEQRIQATREALLQNIESTIRDLHQRIQSDQDRYRLFNESLIPRAETTMSASLSAYAADRIDFLALLDAERMLFDLKMQREEAATRLLQTIAVLERVLGVDSLSEIQF